MHAGAWGRRDRFFVRGREDPLREHYWRPFRGAIVCLSLLVHLPVVGGGRRISVDFAPSRLNFRRREEVWWLFFSFLCRRGALCLIVVNSSGTIGGHADADDVDAGGGGMVGVGATLAASED